jgi:hypothetical protein
MQVPEVFVTICDLFSLFQGAKAEKTGLDRSRRMEKRWERGEQWAKQRGNRFFGGLAGHVVAWDRLNRQKQVGKALDAGRN